MLPLISVHHKPVVLLLENINILAGIISKNVISWDLKLYEHIILPLRKVYDFFFFFSFLGPDYFNFFL